MKKYYSWDKVEEQNRFYDNDVKRFAELTEICDTVFGMTNSYTAIKMAVEFINSLEYFIFGYHSILRVYIAQATKRVSKGLPSVKTRNYYKAPRSARARKYPNRIEEVK